MSLPRPLTVGTGFDTIAHCVETFCSNRSNLPAEGIAVAGLENALGSKRKVGARPDDLAARTDRMWAALCGGLAFQKGLGAVHALSHPLGALEEPNLHHGTLIAVLLPHVLRFNRDAIGNKWEQLAGILCGDDAADPAAYRRALAHDLGVPAGFSAMGVPAETDPAIAEQAVRDHTHATNPRLASKHDYRQLLL
ncbi:hypothetical protein [Acuticoccus sp.]|uniref:hypothetical protein n=1 Tax=Acuticoccus sp. TaxID=1904378 RepID=UPI003B52E73F